MHHCQRVSYIVMLVLFCASGAIAQFLTVETDAETYTLGQTVRVTIHNPTASTVDCNSYPIFGIIHEESGSCRLGCVGLPVMEPIAAGETRVHDHSTSEYSDPVGVYRVVVFESMVSFPPLTTPPTTFYTLTDPTPNKDIPWGGMKSLYR